MKTPEILHTASRQYRHNNSDEFVFGFDIEETLKVFNIMQKALEAQSKLLVCYRAGGQPPESVFDAIAKARGIGLDI
jgi:hypothetical protein